MLSAEEQLRSIEEQLLATGGTPRIDGVIRVMPGDLEGLLRVDLEYTSGHSLRARIAVDTRHGYPNWTRYGFHLLDGSGECIFRYDNAPYHPEVSTYPDHKHVGPSEAVEAHLRPSLHHVIREVMAALGQHETRSS